MLRAYQSPASGTHWADQCAQMPNLASRNQSGVLYCDFKDSHSGLNGPGAMASAARSCRGTAVAASKAELCLNKSRLVNMAASLRRKGQRLAEERQDIILKTESDIAGMRARIDLEIVGDAVIVEHVVQLGGVGAQTVLVSDIQSDGPIEPQVCRILVQHRQRR